MTNPLLAAAMSVKAAVEAAEAEERKRWLEMHVEMTQAELDRLPCYQFTLPTSPRVGFQYKREYWRVPAHPQLGLCVGPHEQAVRWYIGREKLGQESWYRGELESVWFAYTVELDPNDSNYVFHRPKEVKVTD